MRKAILVIDMPLNCNECPLSLDTETYNANLCRAMERHTVNMKSSQKPDWCPLREMPKEREVVFDDESMWAERRRGYNACIDEILNGGMQSKLVTCDTEHRFGEWIPCSERLPEEKTNPVTNDYYVYPVTFNLDGVTDIRYYSFGNGHWHNGLQIMDDDVTAWMQLPEPYREEPTKCNIKNGENTNALSH